MHHFPGDGASDPTPPEPKKGGGSSNSGSSIIRHRQFVSRTSCTEEFFMATIHGSGYDQVIHGTHGDDLIFADHMAAHGTIIGGGGNDTIIGGAGDDLIKDRNGNN